MEEHPFPRIIRLSEVYRDPKRFLNVSEYSRFAALGSVATSPSLIALCRLKLNNRQEAVAAEYTAPVDDARPGIRDLAQHRDKKGGIKNFGRKKVSALALTWAKLTLETVHALDSRTCPVQHLTLKVHVPGRIG